MPLSGSAAVASLGLEFLVFLMKGSLAEKNPKLESRKLKRGADGAVVVC